MSNLISSAAQAEANAIRFRDELDASPELQERLSYARAWYAFPNGEGGWRFVPSKFGGYKDMTAAEYLDDAPRDGRRTEKQLAQWFIEATEGSDLHDELYDGLVAFLDTYNKAPSTKARISVSSEVYAAHTGADEANEVDSAIVDLILLIAGKLSFKELARLRATL